VESGGFVCACIQVIIFLKYFFSHLISHVQAESNGTKVDDEIFRVDEGTCTLSHLDMIASYNKKVCSNLFCPLLIKKKKNVQHK
jgi:hypothetical protein